MALVIDKTNPKRNYKWEPLLREKGHQTRWNSLYLSLSPRGFLAFTRRTHEAMGSPDSYVIVHDSELNVLGLQPARFNVTANAYPAREYGSRGGIRLHAARLIHDFNIYVSATVYFPRAFIDHTGTLILDLKDTRPTVKNGRVSY